MSSGMLDGTQASGSRLYRATLHLKRFILERGDTRTGLRELLPILSILLIILLQRFGVALAA